MRVILTLFSIGVAILSVAFKDTLLGNLGFITNRFSNATANTFEGLPIIPARTAPKPAGMTVSRAIRKAFLAIEQSEGAGARVRRSIGTPQLRNFSPFLMLDHFSVKPGAGFPDHPHSGQETVRQEDRGIEMLDHLTTLLDHVRAGGRCRP
jgi:hypothetical protein